MSWFNRTLARIGLELRSSLENPQTPLSYPAEWLLDIFNGGRTDAGIRVSELTALQVSTVLSCVNIIANGVASLPLYVYSRSIEKGRLVRRIAYDHSLFDLLHDEPNPEMTSPTFRRTMQCHKLLWGNAYAEIQRDSSNRIIAIWPRNPARTRPVRTTEPLKMEGSVYVPGTLVYETYDTIGDSRIVDSDNPDTHYGTRRLVLAEDMLHIPGLSLDGRMGQDVVQLSRQAIGLALASEKYGAKFFGNGAIPSGILGTPGDMTDIQWEILKRSWQESHGGENSHKTGVLPPGVTYTKTGATPQEGQMLETRTYQKADIASIWNVPPHMVGALDKASSGKSTIEQSSLEFLTFCLKSHLIDWEKELKRKLFHKVGQSANKYVPGYDDRQLRYPDAASRTTLYNGGKQWGYFNTNDIHELEGMNPVDDGSGEIYWMPTNMQAADLAAKITETAHEHLDAGDLAVTPPSTTPTGNHPVAKEQKKTAIAAAKAAAAAKPADNGEAGSKKKTQRAWLEKVCGRTFRDAVGRVVTRRKATEADIAQIFAPALHTLIELLELDADEHVDAYLREVFKRSADWVVEKADTIALEECKLAVSFVIARSADRAPTAYGLRHGSTEFNKEDVYRGWSDIGLEPEGIEEVEAASQYLKDVGIQRIISGDLVRVKQTAEIVSKVLGLPIEYDERLRTWNVGEFTGKKKSEFADKLKYYIDNPDVPVPGGESLNDFKKRATEVNQEAIDVPEIVLAVTSLSNLAVGDDHHTKLDGQELVAPAGVVLIRKNGDVKPVWNVGKKKQAHGS